MFILRPTCTFRYTVVFTTMQSLQNKANKMCVKANIWRQKQPTYLKKKKKKKFIVTISCCWSSRCCGGQVNVLPASQLPLRPITAEPEVNVLPLPNRRLVKVLCLFTDRCWFSFCAKCRESSRCRDVRETRQLMKQRSNEKKLSMVLKLFDQLVKASLSGRVDAERNIWILKVWQEVFIQNHALT